MDRDALGSIQACLVRDPRRRATIRPLTGTGTGTGGTGTGTGTGNGVPQALLTMPYLSLQVRP